LRAAWNEFCWDEQDIYADIMEDPNATPWMFPEMLARALELEDAAPKHHNIVDGKFVPDHGELDRLRFCIDDRLLRCSRRRPALTDELGTLAILGRPFGDPLGSQISK
jgi:hypothetical protein